MVAQTPTPSAAARRVALVVLGMNHAAAAADSRFVNRLRGEGHDTSYFEERVASVVIPNVNALAQAVRASDGVVVWIRPEWRTDTAADWPVSYRKVLVAEGFDAPSHEGLANFSLLEGLAVEPGDHYLTSFSLSAFWGGPLLATLRNLQVTNVLMTGCLTEAAVVISATDGTSTGFLTTVVGDACASVSQERHDKILVVHARHFQTAMASDVMTTLTKEDA